MSPSPDPAPLVTKRTAPIGILYQREGQMRPETAISLVMLSLVQEKRNREVGFREDIVRKLKGLKSSNVPVSGIRFRPGIEGPGSEEGSDFVGRLTSAGYVVQESPIKLTEEGLQLLVRHAAEHFRDPEVTQAAGVLGIDAAAFREPARIAVG